MYNQMNVLFSSDNNYAQHLGVAIYSLLFHNKWCEHIVIYIINNHIEEINKKKLEEVVASFDNSEIRWILFDKWKNQLNLSMSWPISISSYARLFVGSMLPGDIDRVLYLDSDMVINASLYDLWNLNLDNDVLAAVQDSISDRVKNAVEVPSIRSYFNAGLLLINLCRWRNDGIEPRCLNYIAEKKGSVLHHDQGVLNHVLQDCWQKLPLKYNVMTIYYIFNRRKILNYYEEHASFYTLEEIELAKNSPVIIHYTPSFTSHPWEENCAHPFKHLYWSFLGKTPWAGVKVMPSSQSWKVKLINWLYRNIPF